MFPFQPSSSKKGKSKIKKICLKVACLAKHPKSCRWHEREGRTNMAPHAKLRFDTEPCIDGWPTEKDKALLMLGGLALFIPFCRFHIVCMPFLVGGLLK